MRRPCSQSLIKFILKVFGGVEVRALCGPVLTHSSHHVCMDLALCTGAHSCWDRKGPPPNLPHNVGRKALSKMSWYAEVLRFPFTGSQRPILAPEKQPHTIILHSPNFTVGTLQSGRQRSPGICPTQTHPSDCETEKCALQLHRTGFHCSSVQLYRALHHSIQCLTLYLVMWSLHATAPPWKPIPQSFCFTVFVLILYGSENLELFSSGWLFRTMCLSTRWPSSVVFHFVTELLLFLNSYIFQHRVIQLTMEYLYLGIKFH